MMRTNNSRLRDLRRVQELQFVIIEIGLYLDSHPNCKRAVEYMGRQKELLNKLANEYQTKYGPLTIFDAEGSQNDSWKWVNTPWPWETEDNN